LRQNLNWEWDTVFRECSQDLKHILFIALIVAHETLDVFLPKPILEKALADSSAVALACKARGRLFKSQGKLQLLLFQFRLKPTWTGHLASLLAYISTPLIVDYKTDHSRFLYPFYRLLRLVQAIFVREIPN
jgi:hypothetical protein